MSNVHIYSASHQPATRFKVDTSSVNDKEIKWMWIRHRKREQIYADCCLERRWAANLTVQVYYDSIRYWCRKGKGCKVTK